MSCMNLNGNPFPVNLPPACAGTTEPPVLLEAWASPSAMKKYVLRPYLGFYCQSVPAMVEAQTPNHLDVTG